jgi:mevalonate pyrophosphate decarboxylase
MGYSTLDAGPNVKILVEAHSVNEWISKLEQLGFKNYIVSRVGGGPRIDIKE